MPNLTLSIDEQTLKRARIQAIEDGTSVNAVVRDYLRDYADGDAAHRTAVEEFVEFARANSAASGPGGRTWTREELYEDRLGSRHG